MALLELDVVIEDTGYVPGSVARLFSYSEHYTENFLVSVSGPPGALRAYRLSFHVGNGITEDGCEC